MLVHHAQSPGFGPLHQMNYVCWPTSVVPTLVRWSQEDQKFSITLGYIVLDTRYQPGLKQIPHLKEKKNKEKETTVTTINLDEVKLDAD